MPRTRRDRPYDNAIVGSIDRGVSFHYRDHQEVLEVRRGERRAGRYGRYHNSGWEACESQLAELEGTEAAILFPSGMSAVASLLLTILQAGQRILYTRCGYRNLETLMQTVLRRFGVDAVGILQADGEAFLAEVERSFNERCRAVFLEMPSNPHLYLVEIEAVRARVGPEALIVVDSTFASPINFQPVAFGADVVVHSGTKYLNGHADVMSGVVLGRRELIDAVRAVRDVSGAIPDPQAVFLLQRGLQTLPLRMQHVNAVGMEVARFLEGHPAVERVFYTGLPSHPQAALAARYLTGHAGVVSFEVRGGEAAAQRFVEATRLPYMGSHFGAAATMIEHLPFFTYHMLSEAERRALGVGGGMVRLGLGLEPPEAVIADLDQALAAAGSGG